MEPKILHSQPTIEKSGEIALFYNIAYNRLCQFIGQYENKKDFEIRNLLDNFLLIDEDKKPKIKNLYKKLLSTKTYFAIYEKIMGEIKGGNMMLGRDEIILINQLLLTFQKVRDYYSHFYHQDTKAELATEIAKWLSKKSEEAQLKYPNPNRKQPKFCVIKQKRKERPEGRTITTYSLTSPKEDITDFYYGQGVDFFLSFFLPRSFMSEYLNQRKGYKRTFNSKEDDIDYTFFRNMCLHFSKRDSNRQNYLNEKGKISPLTYQDYLKIRQQSYLNSLPDFLLPYLKENLISETVIKNPNSFLQLAVACISLDHEMPYKSIIKWEIVNKDLQNEEIEERVRGISRNNKIFIVSSKHKRVYASDFTSEYDQLKITNKRICIQISNIHGDKKVNVLIHEREILSLLYQKLYEPEIFKESIKKLVLIANQYAAFLKDALNDRVKSIQKYGPLKPFIESEEIDWRKDGIYHTHFPGLNKVFQLFFEANDYNSQEIREKVIQKLKHTQSELNKMLVSHGRYDFLNIPTLVYETPQAVKGLETKSKKDWTEEDIENWENWISRRKELKGIRHKKMQLALYAKNIILGKKARFTSQNEKKSFMVYAYLLDKKEPNRPLLIRETQEKLSQKIHNEKQQIFNKRYLGALLNSESFDEFVKAS